MISAALILAASLLPLSPAQAAPPKDKDEADLFAQKNYSNFMTLEEGIETYVLEKEYALYKAYVAKLPSLSIPARVLPNMLNIYLKELGEKDADFSMSD